MAKKAETRFECSHCGSESPKWLGRCPSCGEWNTYLEVRLQSASSVPKIGGGGTGRVRDQATPLARPRLLQDITVGPEDRLGLGSGEFDRVLGGGMLRSSAVLLGGEPGIGKSTLLLQAAAHVALSLPVLYVSGEESEQQIKLRAARLGCPGTGIHLLASSHLEDIIEAIIETQPGLVIVDSVQTLFSPDSGSAPGTPAQIRYCVHMVSETARNQQAGLLLIAHVTKDGSIAGPKLLEHMVDVVLYFEEGDEGLRILRSWKNRYGSTDEIGLFAMGAKGLAEIRDPANLLVEERTGTPPPGVALTPLYEGSRVLMVELQALVVTNKAGISRVNSDRIDQRRIARIAAVLEKHGGLSFSDQEIYVNVAGGFKVQEVASDLAIAAALYSARSGLSLPARCALTGEVSLSGEIRRVRHAAKRLQAVQDLGIGQLHGPVPGKNDLESGAAGWIPTRDIEGLIRQLFGRERSKNGA